MSVNKYTSTPEGILVRLKNKIMLKIGLDGNRLKIIIDRFVKKNMTEIPPSKAHFAKINIYNELNKEKMTIKVFFKFLRILNIKNVNITIKLTTESGKEILVSEDINMFTQEINDDE